MQFVSSVNSLGLANSSPNIGYIAINPTIQQEDASKSEARRTYRCVESHLQYVSIKR